MIRLFEGKDCVTAASIALKHRLFVPGWCLSGAMKCIRKGHNIEDARMAIAYDSDTPVGVCLYEQTAGLIQVFVRKSHRRRGIGRSLVENFKNTKTYGIKGINKSPYFFQNVGVRCRE
jgi:GNAT superfamily N-acetyltransferase